MKKVLFVCSLLMLVACSNFESSTNNSASTSSYSFSENTISESTSSEFLSSESSSSIVDKKNYTRIITCTDYQGVSGNEESEGIVSSILSSMKKDNITSADAFFCCGDYDYDLTNIQVVEGINSLKSVVNSYVSEDNMIFVQGNHDILTPGTNGLAKSGNNDPIDGKYGAFVINEDDYMWTWGGNYSEETVKSTALNLENYLNEKIEENYDKPIFILAHLPLHYNMRGIKDANGDNGDGKHSKYIFDVLNGAGDRGLNIVYMFGHNHSDGYDDYLGGSNIYLKSGDNILIADHSTTEFSEHKLNFTYMNAGYVGYYKTTNENADKTLSMTVFDIYEDYIDINRYSSDGKYALKAKGSLNSGVGESEDKYIANETIYESPQKISLNKNINNILINSNQSYKKVSKLTDITDGEYLIVYNDNSSNKLVIPNVVTKANSSGSERTGFDLEKIIINENDVVGEYALKTWTISLSNNNWLMKNKDGYLKFKESSSGTAIPSFENNGEEITIESNNDGFIFNNGTYYFNYNSRELIHGYNSRSQATTFNLYKKYTPIVKTYTKVNDYTELTDGEYLFVYINEGTTKLMIPNIVTKANSSGSERTGFDVEAVVPTNNVIKGDYTSKTWTISSSDNKWKIGLENSYVKFIDVGGGVAQPMLSTEGDLFTINDKNGEFSFTNGTFNFAYNNRELINGYTGNEALFNIYKVE